MHTIPTGAPAWVRTNTHETYGGNTEKRDYQAQGPVNPLTDVGAQQFCRMAADMQALAAVAEFATITYLCNDAAPGAPTIERYDGMAGAAPTPTRNGNGDVTFVWAASYNDAYSRPGALHIVHAEVAVHGTTAAHATVVIDDSNADGLNDRVRVRAWTVGGAAKSDARVTLTVTTGPV